MPQVMARVHGAMHAAGGVKQAGVAWIGDATEDGKETKQHMAF